MVVRRGWASDPHSGADTPTAVAGAKKSPLAAGAATLILALASATALVAVGIVGVGQLGTTVANSDRSTLQLQPPATVTLPAGSAASARLDETVAGSGNAGDAGNAGNAGNPGSAAGLRGTGGPAAAPAQEARDVSRRDAASEPTVVASGPGSRAGALPGDGAAASRGDRSMPLDTGGPGADQADLPGDSTVPALPPPITEIPDFGWVEETPVEEEPVEEEPAEEEPADDPVPCPTPSSGDRPSAPPATDQGGDHRDDPRDERERPGWPVREAPEAPRADAKPGKDPERQLANDERPTREEPPTQEGPRTREEPRTQDEPAPNSGAPGRG